MRSLDDHTYVLLGLQVSWYRDVGNFLAHAIPLAHAFHTLALRLLSGSSGWLLTHI